MAEKKQTKLSRKALLDIIEQAAREGAKALDLSNKGISELPPEIGQLTNLQSLDLHNNQLTTLSEATSQLTNLQSLKLYNNQLTTLPEAIAQLTNLQSLDLHDNQLTTLPEAIAQLTNLTQLIILKNQLTELPDSIRQLTALRTFFWSENPITILPEWLRELSYLERFDLDHRQLKTVPEWVIQWTNLQSLYLNDNQLTTLPETIGQLTNLQSLFLYNNQLTTLPETISQLTNLRSLYLQGNQLTMLPEAIGQLTNLQSLYLSYNQLTTLPGWLAHLEKLKQLKLNNNPLNPALQSAYEGGLDQLLAYLRSLEDAEPLYEAKLVLVGEGGAGKTTLLKAVMGQETRADEPTTHGINIDIQSLRLPHPDQAGLEIQFNAWDFGGQKVYRVTHQFFFSRNAVYLLVWEPRAGVERGLVEEWLKLIRLRVGDGARVIIVATHCKSGKRIARIDEPVFLRDYGSMIVGFHEVDSLVLDEATHDKVGMAGLRNMIASAAKDLAQMGQPFSVRWRNARDELIALGQARPHVHYTEFAQVCSRHGLAAIDAQTLATLMHDLGYIIHYGDDERLQNDVVLQPEWLTRAIGFVLEDRATAQMDGILPDHHLREIWYEKPLDEAQTRFEPALYPFFLRLMERFDVSYRLETGDASLVAQHVPQVRPDLPWLPHEEPKPEQRRLALTCMMEEEPPGLVPWMIVRTQDYAHQERGSDGKLHRLHWQKGMFLRNHQHGEAMLELIGREFHLHAEAAWPEYFVNKLRQILQTLISDNWPGLKDRYYFAVPCPVLSNGKACEGRFDIGALRQFLDEGDTTYRCQVCRTRHEIVELLYGFEDEDEREQLARIERKVDEGFAETQQTLAELNSRLAKYVMTILYALANEAKAGPRLFVAVPADEDWARLDPRQLFTKRYRLYLWCEAEDCMHPVSDFDKDKGMYEFQASKAWVKLAAPYANFIAGVLKAVLPMVTPAVNVFFDGTAFDASGWKDRLDLMKAASSNVLKDIDVRKPGRVQTSMLDEAERSGVMALHSFLSEHDPNHERLGLRRVPMPTGDYQWLCERHYQAAQPRIPDQIR